MGRISSSIGVVPHRRFMGIRQSSSLIGRMSEFWIQDAVPRVGNVIGRTAHRGEQQTWCLPTTRVKIGPLESLDSPPPYKYVNKSCCKANGAADLFVLAHAMSSANRLLLNTDGLGRRACDRIHQHNVSCLRQIGAWRSVLQWQHYHACTLLTLSYTRTHIHCTVQAVHNIATVMVKAQTTTFSFCLTGLVVQNRLIELGFYVPLDTK